MILWSILQFVSVDRKICDATMKVDTTSTGDSQRYAMAYLLDDNNNSDESLSNFDE